MKKLTIAQKGKYLEMLLTEGHVDATRPGPLDAYLRERGFYAHYAWSYGEGEHRHAVWRYFSPIKHPEHYQQKKTA